jgi:hypothetical protein
MNVRIVKCTKPYPGLNCLLSMSLNYVMLKKIYVVGIEGAKSKVVALLN